MVSEQGEQSESFRLLIASIRPEVEAIVPAGLVTHSDSGKYIPIISTQTLLAQVYE